MWWIVLNCEVSIFIYQFGFRLTRRIQGGEKADEEDLDAILAELKIETPAAKPEAPKVMIVTSYLFYRFSNQLQLR